MSSTCNLPKLSDNVAFSNWKFRVRVLLEEKGLAEVLDKNEENKKEGKENLSNEAKAKSVIVQCLSDRYLDIVKKCATASEMILALESVFERKSVFNKLYLRKKLLSMKLENNQKLQDHFLKFDGVIGELEAAGGSIPMEDSDKLTHLFLTLPDKYNTVITTLETMSAEKELTIPFVKSRLLDAELKMEQNDSKTTEESSFLTCYKCGKEGHMAYKCSKKQPYRGRSRGRGRGYFRGRGQSHAAEGSSEMFIALSSEQIIEDQSSHVIFVVDSGATHNFIQAKYEQYMTDVVKLGQNINIKIANGEVLTATKKGQLRVYYNDQPVIIEGLIVGGIAHNLLSVNELV